MDFSKMLFGILINVKFYLDLLLTNEDKSLRK